MARALGNRPAAPGARKGFLFLALLFLALGIWQTAAGLYIPIKAAVAQILLNRAWQRTLATGRDQKPWPWADTWPVAKIIVPRLDKTAIVLDKASGQALAFGPAVMETFAPLGASGTSIIAAHRDTHFAFLKNLEAGDLVLVETRQLGTLRFRVTGSRVVDTRGKLIVAEVGAPRLILSTCYPFDAVGAGTPYRYLVFAAPAPN